jgi:hypothetical protein
LRVSGRLRVAVHDPLGSEDRRRTPRADALDQISWGSAVLAATYKGLCSAVTRPTSREAILLGCPLLIQMWIHERFDIGRPRTDLSEYEPPADGTDPADLPTMGSLWCLRKVMTSLYVILRVMTSVVQFT